MLRLLPVSAAVMSALLIATPIYAQQGGDMFGSGPKLSPNQPDMLPTQTPETQASDVFHDQPAAPARDMFPQQTPDTSSADMFGNASKGTAPEDVFPARAQQAPSDALYHNPNANGP